MPVLFFSGSLVHPIDARTGGKRQMPTSRCLKRVPLPCKWSEVATEEVVKAVAQEVGEEEKSWQRERQTLPKGKSKE